MINLLRKYFHLIAHLNQKQIAGEGLAALRITYTFVLMCEIAHFYFFRQLFFDVVPFTETFELGNFRLVFLVWECVLFLLMIGAFTRTVAIVNYILTLVFISEFTTFEYHVMYAYTGINFLFMFTDISKCFSVDRLLLRLKYSTPNATCVPDTTASALHYLIIPFCGLGLVYFDSIFYKFGSHLWTHGLGMWLPSSLPFVTHINMSWLLNIKWLVLGMGYLTLLFESVFIFIFWHRFARIPLLIVGLGLHAGIILQFPIPLFGLCALTIYVAMVPVSWWKKLQNLMHSKTKKLYVFYDAECPYCIRAKVLFESLDIRRTTEWKSVQVFANDEQAFNNLTKDDLLGNLYCVTAAGKVFSGYKTYTQIFKSMFCLRPLAWLMKAPPISIIGIKVHEWIASNRETMRYPEDVCRTGLQTIQPQNSEERCLFPGVRIKDVKTSCWCMLIALLLALQVNVTMKSIIGRQLIETTHLKSLGFGYSTKLGRLSKSFFGITAHPVFMDNHFHEYNSISAYEWESHAGEKTWLPIIDERGMPGLYNYGANWVAWTFRFNSRSGNLEHLAQRVPRWLVFWAKKNGVELSDGKFNIYLKRVDSPTQWEHDFLNKQLGKPFRKVGEAKWNGTELAFFFDNKTQRESP